MKWNLEKILYCFVNLLSLFLAPIIIAQTQVFDARNYAPPKSITIDSERKISDFPKECLDIKHNEKNKNFTCIDGQKIVIDIIITDAKENKKAILFLYGSSYCKSCETLKEEIVKEKKVITESFWDDVIVYHLDTTYVLQSHAIQELLQIPGFFAIPAFTIYYPKPDNAGEAEILFYEPVSGKPTSLDLIKEETNKITGKALEPVKESVEVSSGH